MSLKSKQVDKSYRIAVAADAEELMRIGNEAFLADEEFKLPEHRLRYKSPTEILETFESTVNAEFLVCEVDVGSSRSKAIAGSIRVSWERKEGILVGEFGGVACLPQFGRMGIGSGLVRAAEKHVTAKRESKEEVRMEMVVLGLRPDLIPWYERQGYARTGSSFKIGPGPGKPWIVEFEGIWMGKIIATLGSSTEACMMLGA